MGSQNIQNYTRIKLEEVDSTNAYAIEHFRFFDDKTVINAAKQTNGRGRFDRKWISDESDNVYMSIVLKPKNCSNPPYANFTQYLSVVLCRFFKSVPDLDVKIKWPNDILADGRKISGILAEACFVNNKIDGIVLGLGLNVNLKPETVASIDQKAVSLSMLTGKNYDVDTIVDQISDMFFEDYDRFLQTGFKSVRDEYISKCGFLGKKITVSEAGKRVKYTASDIDDDGLLTVRDENNNISKIITGDIIC